MTTQSSKTILLATDQQRSVLIALDAAQPYPIAHAPYGYRPPENGLLSLLGFIGELPDPLTGHYHLGQGYRQYSPVLMRFTRPDPSSPFGDGWLNTYGYCGGDPRNRVDPTGRSWFALLSSRTPLSRIPRIKVGSEARTVLPRRWHITENVKYIDKQQRQLTRVIDDEGNISKVLAENPGRAFSQSQEAASSRGTSALPNISEQTSRNLQTIVKKK
jgi:RHS repeat-associated protein